MFPFILLNFLFFCLSFFVSFYGGILFLHIFLIAMSIVVFIENNLSQSVMKSMWCLTLSAVWATSNHAFINVSAYFYWVQWFWSLPEKVRFYWTFRYFKVNHFETMEINICRWLNKLFIASVCVRACVSVCLCACVRVCVRQIVLWQMLTGIQMNFQGFSCFFEPFWFFLWFFHMTFYDERLIIALLWLKSNF